MEDRYDYDGERYPRRSFIDPNPNPNPDPDPDPNPKPNPNPNRNPNPDQALRQLIATPDPFLALRARASWSEPGLELGTLILALTVGLGFRLGLGSLTEH